MTDPSIILDIEPDWGVEPEVSYSFTTVVQDTPYFVEQRRPLLASPVRSANYKFTESNEQFQRLCNTLVEAKDRQICVPIFSEPIFAASIVTGGSSITTTTSLTYLWNINHCSYVVLLNFVTGESEMIGVTSVSGQLIRLATNIVGVWIAAQTAIFPAIAAELVSMKQSFATDSIGSIEAEFSESVLGAEATGDWVGLDEQTCCEDLTVAPVCSEYFNGTDGNPLSSTVIEDTGYFAGGATVSIYNNSLRHVAVAGLPDGYQHQYTTTFSFLGEFDFYLSYYLWNVSNTNSGWIYIQPPEDSEIFGVEWWYGGGGKVNYYAAGSTAEMDYIETSQMTGKLRMTRDSSNNIRVFYWNESLSRWEANGDTSGIIIDNYSGAFTPVFEVFSGYDDPIIDVLDFVTTTGCDNTQPVTP